ncbi:MAG: hypothetical protein QM589_19315 [Thermomicrobiales bacterium]
MASIQGPSQPATRSISHLTRWDRAVSSFLRSITDTLLDPVIILAATLFMLGGSPAQVAAPAAVTAFLWAAGPFVIPAIARLVGAVMPLAIAGVVLRVGAAILILAIGLRIQRLSSGDAVVAILLCYTFFQLGVALTDETWGSPWANGNGRRISAFGWVTLVTAIVSSLAAIAAARTLDPMRVNFPHSVGLLFVLAALAALSACWFLVLGEFMQTDDDLPDSASESDVRLQSSSGYRYLSFQILWAVSRLADPFVIVFALSEMSLSFRYVGGALASYALLRGVGQLIASSRPRALPPARMLQLGSFLRFVFLVVAGGISVAASSTWYRTEVRDSDAASWALALAFGALGVAVAFSDDAQRRYLGHLEGRTAPDATGIGLPGMLLALLSLSPFAGAWIVGRFSLEGAIVSAAIVSFLAMLASALLDMPIRRRRVPIRRTSRRRR